MKGLAGKSIAVFDLEIKEEIGKNGVTWKTYNKMGISVGCAFDYRTMDYRVFMDDNLHELGAMVSEVDLLVGFNIIGFDLPLLSAYSKFERSKEIYDLLYWSRIACGWEPDEPGDPYPSGLKLDDHLRGTFGEKHMKTANGAEAPIFWQQKRYGKLISYCLDDVKRERWLFEHVVSGKPVVTAKHGQKTLELPKFLQEAQ